MSIPSRLLPSLLLGLLLLGTAPVNVCAQTPDSTEEAPPLFGVERDEPKADVPFVKSPQPVVDSMLALANLSSSDVLYDLGSGNGRIPITAARDYGARGVGIEIKPDLVDKARTNADDSGVSELVEFRQGDLFEADISEATVVTLYLLPSVNLELRPKLFRELKPGTRVVSHDFDMDEWSPDTTLEVENSRIYLWTIPEEPPPFVDREDEN